MSKPTVTIAFSEGRQPTLAGLFCNNVAQLPVHVSVEAGGAVIEEVGMCKAFDQEISLNPSESPQKALEELLCIEPVSDLSGRKYEAHPSNLPQEVPLNALQDDARTFLISSKNNAGLVFGRDNKIYIGAYAKLGGYVATPGASPESIYVYSYMHANNSAGMLLSGMSRAALSLYYKPQLNLNVIKEDMSTYGLRGEKFTRGAIYRVKPSYGIYAQVYTPKILSTETEIYKKGSGDDYVALDGADVSKFKMSPDDDEDGVDTFYADSPKGHKNVVLRGIFHGSKKRGQITQPLESGSAQYKYDLGEDGVASFSWYYMFSDKLNAKDVGKLQGESIEDGQFKTSVTDVYGSGTVLSVTCKTAYAGYEPVELVMRREVEI